MVIDWSEQAWLLKKSDHLMISNKNDETIEERTVW
jgi:hypothetical protein